VPSHPSTWAACPWGVSKLTHQSLTNRININITIPEFSIPALDSLENVTIPTSFEDSLIRLNSSLPTLNDLRDKINNIIEIPFEALKKEINETRIEMAASFNSSILPVPSLSQLSATKDDELNQELCSDLDTSLIDDTANALHKLSNMALGLMFLLLFLIWAAMCFWEWRRWRALKDTVETIEEEWNDEGKSDAWRAVAVVENPVLEKYGSTILRRLSSRARTRTNMRWYSEPAGLSRVLAVDLQWHISLIRHVSLCCVSPCWASCRFNSSS